MYKLSQLYNEIKLISPPTPQMVEDLWTKIDNEITRNERGEYKNLLKTSGWTSTPDELVPLDWLKALSKQDLAKMYLGLQNLEKKINKVNEIKLIPKVTPEIVHELYWDMWQKTDNISQEYELKELKKKCFGQDFGISSPPKHSAPYVILNASSNQLQHFYKELLNFKSKYNIQ